MGRAAMWPWCATSTPTLVMRADPSGSIWTVETDAFGSGTRPTSSSVAR